MSSNNFSSSSSYSYSSSSTTSNGQTTGHRAVQQSQSGPNGTTVTSATQNMGEPIVQETRRFDNQGRQLVDGNDGSAPQRQVTDVSDSEQAARDQQYLERMEEEYAKREGGA